MSPDPTVEVLVNECDLAALRAENARLRADLDDCLAAVHDLCEDQSGEAWAAAARGEVLALLGTELAAGGVTVGLERDLSRICRAVRALGPARDPLPPQRLRVRVAELEGALAPFVAYCAGRGIGGLPDDTVFMSGPGGARLTLGQVRAGLRALGREEVADVRDEADG